MDIDFQEVGSLELVQERAARAADRLFLPVQRNDLPAASGPVSPILQLHREIDRLFDDAFRGFGFPALAMPRLPSDWSGMLKPALDIQETDKRYKIALEVPGVERHPDHPRQRRAGGAWRGSARTGEEGRWLPHRGSAPTAAFTAP